MNQVLRDRYGRKIGEIIDQGTRQIIRDEYGCKLGEFDGRYTRDERGMIIGEGNLLAALLRKF